MNTLNITVKPFLKGLFYVFIVGLLFLSCSEDVDDADKVVPAEPEEEEEKEVYPQWVEGYPKVEPGASSLSIKIELDKSGKVYYVLTTGELEEKSSVAIKAEALAEKTANIIQNGVIDVAKDSQETIKQLKGLAANKNYNLYMVGGSDSLLMPDSLVIVVESHISSRQTAVPSGTTTSPYGYYEYLPEGYSASSNEKYPLLIFLHGGKEIGDGKNKLSLVLKQGPTKVIDSGREFPFICLSPQTATSWNPSIVNSFIKYAIENYNVDENRIYLTGLSMGAIGVYAYALEHPTNLAAIVPVAGKGSFSEACKIKDLPIWAFHNQDDPQIPVSGSTNMVNAIKDCGGSPKITIYPGTVHDAWTAAYNEDELWTWLITQAKKN